jgi:hypothetical protein
MTHHRLCKYSNTTDITSGAVPANITTITSISGTSYPSGAPQFTFGVHNVHTRVKLQGSRITLPIVDILRTVRRRVFRGVQKKRILSHLSKYDMLNAILIP